MLRAAGAVHAYAAAQLAQGVHNVDDTSNAGARAHVGENNDSHVSVSVVVHDSAVADGSRMKVAAVTSVAATAAVAAAGAAVQAESRGALASHAGDIAM